nr:ribonucleoside-diphosphate reductase large subunit [Ipomoea batatas]
MGLWSPLKNQIIYEVGSVQKIPEIPDELKLIYKTVWEIKQRTLVDMAADHGCYIDQSQSLNIHTDGPTQFWKAYFHGCDYNMKVELSYENNGGVATFLSFGLKVFLKVCVYDVNHGDQPRSLTDVKEIKKDVVSDFMLYDCKPREGNNIGVGIRICMQNLRVEIRRELYRTNDFADAEDCEEVESAREWNSAEAFGSDSEDDVEYEEENNHNLLNRRQLPTHPLAVVIYEALNGYRVGGRKLLSS